MIVGNIAPDFSAQGFAGGGIKSISLHDYKGKWVVLFFYSGDFTTV